MAMGIGHSLMIIKSLLDTDLYKFTMMQVVFKHFRQVKVNYLFQCRNQQINLTSLKDSIQAEVQKLENLSLQEDELSYLKKLPYFTTDFIDYLRHFKLNSNHVSIQITDGSLSISIQGSWLETILFEIPILMIVADKYYQTHYPQFDLTQAKKNLANDIKAIQNLPTTLGSNHGEIFQFMEFGSRRRFSFSWQEQVLEQLIDKVPQNLMGTSNVYFAKQFGITPLGTMAHEYIQACQALTPDLRSSQIAALKLWQTEYPNHLATALSDTYGTAAFLHDFSLDLATHYHAVRQDSGDPALFAQQLIKHYQSLDIDPLTKTIIFSDGLSVNKAIKLHQRFSEIIHTAFGIGTQLTCNVGVSAIQCVIKMTQCNNQPVAKISDTPEKTMCTDHTYLSKLKDIFQV